MYCPKRVKQAIVSLLLLVSFAVSAKTSSFVVDGVKYYISNRVTYYYASVDGYVGQKENVVIPATIKDPQNRITYNVDYVRDFKSDVVESITFEGDISIMKNSFGGQKLREITFNGAAEAYFVGFNKSSVQTDWFGSCPNLEGVIFKNGFNTLNKEDGTIDRAYNTKIVFYVRDSDINKLRSFTKQYPIVSYDLYQQGIRFVDFKRYIRGVEFAEISSAGDFDSIIISNSSVDDYIVNCEDNNYIISNLAPETKYIFNIRLLKGGDSYEGELSFCTDKFKLSYDKSKETQRTITLQNIALTNPDKTITQNCSVGYRVKETIYLANKDFDVVINNLTPNTKYEFVEVLISDETHIYEGRKFSLSTADIRKSLNIYPLGPTGMSIRYSYDVGDASFTSKEILFNGEVIEEGSSSEIILWNLEPGAKYDVRFAVVASGGTTHVSKSIYLEDLQLMNLSADILNNNSARVHVETNVNDEEKGLGFQWRKYDAPESLPTSEAFGITYHGELNGVIHNLQSNSYYKVRAFYKDRNGKYLFSDWLTIDPNDFSYFEPIIHTYPIQNVFENSAQAKALVLEGSEPFISQGFQYWKADEVVSMTEEYSQANNIYFVEADGSNMVATLQNLESGTTYTVRPYVETVKGFVYGEEESFMTLGECGIVPIIIKDKPDIIGYYSVYGQKLLTPCKGINIIVYSDGSCEKLILK